MTTVGYGDVTPHTIGGKVLASIIMITGSVTVSIGIAVFDPESGETTTEILNRADAALYQAKDDGRNRVVIAKPDSADRRLSA